MQSNLPRLPSRAGSIGGHTNTQSFVNSASVGYRQSQVQMNFRNGKRLRFGKDETLINLSSLADAGYVEDEDVEDVPLKEDEAFQKAVEEVKDAALNVTESSVKLTSTIVTKGPGIIGRLLKAVLSKEFRYVCICQFLNNSSFEIIASLFAYTTPKDLI
jgi:hypothetical protein